VIPQTLGALRPGITEVSCSDAPLGKGFPDHRRGARGADGRGNAGQRRSARTRPPPLLLRLPLRLEWQHPTCLPVACSRQLAGFVVMAAGLRRAALAMHLITSVGWIGAAAAYLAAGVAARVSDQVPTVRAAWISMELIGWLVIVPLGCLAFLTGLVMSVGTRWGLIRHYWVLIALVLTSLALVVLILHMPSVSAGAAVARTGDDRAVLQLGGDIAHPALGLVVLVVVAVINLYKPRGLTRYGQRQHAAAEASPSLGSG
jgi:hypothetical protein